MAINGGIFLPPPKKVLPAKFLQLKSKVYVSNSTGIGLRGTQMVDIRQPRGRLDLEVDKQ